jgi:ABC-type multidrug transport system fused ATPase/permease subunit
MIALLKKIFQIINGNDRKKIILLLLVNILSSFAGLVGVASIIPFVVILSNPESLYSIKQFKWILEYLNVGDINQFVVIMGIITTTVFVFCNLIIAASAWYNIRFARKISYNLSCTLFKLYLSHDYQFYLGRNSSTLTKNMFTEVGNVIILIIRPIIDIISKGLTSLFLVAFLVIISPAIAFGVIGLLGGFYGIIYIALRKKLITAGTETARGNNQRFLLAGEVFGGIKDVKLLGKEKEYFSRFIKIARNYENHQSSVMMISQMPKYVLETIAFSSILIISLLLFKINGSISGIIHLITLYAFAGYRLLPAMETIFRSATVLKGSRVSLDLIYDDIVKTSGKINTHVFSGNVGDIIRLGKEIRVDNVEFSYNVNNDFRINIIGFSIKANSMVGLVGKTGCGKTTIVDIILGLLPPHAGSILVDDQLLTDQNIQAWQRNIGYVSQNIFLSDDTVASNIAFGVETDLIDMDAVVKAAKIANIHDFVSNEMSGGYKTRIGERGIRLSGGQRQRIGIARALYRNPDVLVFDEATSALDNLTEAAVMEAINNLMGTKTIILIAHRLTTVKKCDAVLLIEKGEIIASGTFDELLEKSHEFREVANYKQ